MTPDEPQPARERFDLTDPAVGGVRSLASRYFLCADLVVAVVGLVVIAVATPIIVLARSDGQLGDAVPAGVLLYLVAALVGLAILRRPSRTERREHGRSGTGFAEVRRVREMLRSGGDLDPAQQEVADDLARVCARRGSQMRRATVVVVVLVLLFGALLVQGLDSLDANRILGGATTVVVVLAVLVAERRRTAAVRADLLGPGPGTRA